MALETYNPYKKHKKPVNKEKRSKLFLVVTFIFVAITILINPGEVKNINLTGKVIMSHTSSNSSIPINANISLNDLSLNDEFHKLIIETKENSSLKIGNKRFYLNENNKEIILKNFKGKISADKNTLNELTGKAEEIILNKIPISKDTGRISITLEEETEYTKIETSEETKIKNYESIADGKIIIEKDLISLNSDTIILQNYLGPIKLENQKIFFNGKISKLEIKSENKNMVFSD